MAKIKVKKETNGDPPATGAISYLNSYYQSPEFKKRFLLNNSMNDYQSQMSHFKYASARHKVFTLQKDPYQIDSRIGTPSLNKIIGHGLPEDATIILSVPQAKKYGMDLQSEVLPHEYTHNIRKRTNNDDILPLIFNKDAERKIANYTQYLKDKPNTTLDYSSWVKLHGDNQEEAHDATPDEQISDLGALRYLMFKEGIYDTRKGDMNLDHIQKAIRNKNIGKSFMMQRLLKNFTPEKIVKFNNTVAMNDDFKNNPNQIA